MKKILIPIDFSDNSLNALEYASNLFKNEVCDFYILNTYNIEPLTSGLSAVRDIEESKQKSITGLANILEKFSVNDTSVNHQFYMVSECGSLIEIMKKIIDKHNIYIVVMGTKGMTNFRLNVYGSQTVLAMEKIRNCPVLAIPAKVKFNEIKEIVFPTDYKNQYKKKELQYLIDMAVMTNSEIKIVHFLNNGENFDEDKLKNKKHLSDYFNGVEYSSHSLHNNDVHLGLNSFIKDQNSGMVTFINKKHTFFDMILSKPMMKNLGYHSTIPVLALHDLRS